MRHLSGAHAFWDEQVEMLANVVDAIERTNYYLLKVNGNELQPPEPVRRPGVASEPDSVSLAQFNQFLKG